MVLITGGNLRWMGSSIRRLHLAADRLKLRADALLLLFTLVNYRTYDRLLYSPRNPSPRLQWALGHGTYIQLGGPLLAGLVHGSLDHCALNHLWVCIPARYSRLVWDQVERWSVHNRWGGRELAVRWPHWPNLHSRRVAGGRRRPQHVFHVRQLLCLLNEYQTIAHHNRRL